MYLLERVKIQPNGTSKRFPINMYRKKKKAIRAMKKAYKKISLKDGVYFKVREY